MDTDDDLPSATPRFVPTLTEVVGARADTEPAPAGLPTLAPESEMGPDSEVDFPLELSAEPAVVPLPPVSLEAIAATVLQRIGPDLDRQIGEAIARVLHEQIWASTAGCRRRWPKWCVTPSRRPWRRARPVRMSVKTPNWGARDTIVSPDSPGM